MIPAGDEEYISNSKREDEGRTMPPYHYSIIEPSFSSVCVQIQLGNLPT